MTNRFYLRKVNFSLVTNDRRFHFGRTFELISHPIFGNQQFFFLNNLRIYILQLFLLQILL